MIAGFALDDLGPSLEDWDRWSADAGLMLADRWGTWDRDPLPDRPRYAVSAHRAAGDA